jgi:hypothetical protein
MYIYIKDIKFIAKQRKSTALGHSPKVGARPWPPGVRELESGRGRRGDLEGVSESESERESKRESKQASERASEGAS